MQLLFSCQLSFNPLAVLVFSHYVHLIVATGHSEQITHLTPTDLVEGNLTSESNLTHRPIFTHALVSTIGLLFVLLLLILDLFRIFAILGPHDTRFVFGAAGNHIELKTKTRTPCDVTNPILMIANYIKRRFLRKIVECPHLNKFISASCCQSHCWQREFLLSFISIVLLTKNGRLSTGSP